MLKPILTEKSLSDAKGGEYTFLASPSMTKFQIKKEVEKAFGVKVKKIRTARIKSEVKKNYKGYKKVTKPAKKAFVKLGEKEKIDLFEVKD